MFFLLEKEERIAKEKEEGTYKERKVISHYINADAVFRVTDVCVYLLVFVSSQSLKRRHGGVSPSMPALQTKPSKRCWSRNASPLK